MPKAWTTADIPSLTGKIALITGATGGLGYESALALAAAGCTVILAGRSEEKGKTALGQILALHPSASVDFGRVDLASLSSITSFATSISAKYDHLDILMLNAGVMIPPKRETTADGFEIQLGTNYLSHFALTAKLLPMLRRSSAPRIVPVSSLAHRQGKINFEDLQSEKTGYGWGVYAQSKLAMLMFAFELQRRSDKGGWGITCVAAHPGIAKTDLVSNGPGNSSFSGFFMKNLIIPLTGGTAKTGALPQIYASVADDAAPGGYYGPSGFHETKGNVGPSFVACQAKDEEVARKLWEVSCELTGVEWP